MYLSNSRILVKSDDPRFTMGALEIPCVEDKAVYFVAVESGTPPWSIRYTRGM